MNIDRVHTVAPKNTTNRGSGCVDDELRADDARDNPTMVFASPPMPITPLDSASWTSPANVPVSSPVTGPDVSAT